MSYVVNKVNAKANQVASKKFASMNPNLVSPDGEIKCLKLRYVRLELSLPQHFDCNPKCVVDYQIPLSIVCRSVETRYGPKWGNIIVWSSLIVGQPLCIMMYYHDYVITHFGKALIESYAKL